MYQALEVIVDHIEQVLGARSIGFLRRVSTFIVLISADKHTDGLFLSDEQVMPASEQPPTNRRT
jgi:hypothetical protein